MRSQALREPIQPHRGGYHSRQKAIIRRIRVIRGFKSIVPHLRKSAFICGSTGTVSEYQNVSVSAFPLTQHCAQFVDTDAPSVLL